MKIGLFYKKETPIIQTLFSLFSNSSHFLIDLTKQTELVDLIISLGGDGTTLKCVLLSLQIGNVPILSVNTGDLGFLSAYETTEIDNLFYDLNNNAINYEELTLLKCNLNGESHFALNDVVIERSHSQCETATFSVFIDDALIKTEKSDGVIVATPTGSTAYSFSASSAIIHPSVECFILSSICSHLKNRGSIIYPQSLKANVKIEKAVEPCSVFCDGTFVGNINEGVNLEILQHTQKIRIVRNKSFFTVLNHKFN